MNEADATIRDGHTASRAEVPSPPPVAEENRQDDVESASAAAVSDPESKEVKIAVGISVGAVNHDATKVHVHHPPTQLMRSERQPPLLLPGAFSIAGVSVGASAESTDNTDPQECTPPPPGAEQAFGPDTTTTTTIVSAVKVEEDTEAGLAQLEAEIRNRIRQEAVEADVVAETETTPVHPHALLQKSAFLLCSAAVLVVVAVLLGVFLRPGDDKDNDQDNNSPITSIPIVLEEDTRPTMDIVRERGFVRCGVYDGALGFSSPNPETGGLEGINIDQVRESFILFF